VAFAAVLMLWGIPYLFIKVAVDDGVRPASVAWARVPLAAVVLLALAWRAGTLRTVGGRWRWLCVYAIFQISIPFPLIATGEQHVSSSLAAIIIAAVALIVGWSGCPASWRWLASTLLDGPTSYSGWARSCSRRLAMRPVRWSSSGGSAISTPARSWAPALRSHRSCSPRRQRSTRPAVCLPRMGSSRSWSSASSVRRLHSC
jgi:hypothetical protein